MSEYDTAWGAAEMLVRTDVDIDEGPATLAVRKLRIDQDEMTTLHRHDDQTQVFLVEQGLVELRVGDDYHELGPGDEHVVNAGEPHQLQNIDDRVAAVTEISLPYDPDDETVDEDPYAG